MKIQAYQPFLNEFNDWMKMCGWSTRTIESYTENIQSFIGFIRQNTTIHSLSDVTSKMIKDYQNYLYNHRVSSGQRLSVFSQHFKLVSVRA